MVLVQSKKINHAQIHAHHMVPVHQVLANVMLVGPDLIVIQNHALIIVILMVLVLTVYANALHNGQEVTVHKK